MSKPLKVQASRSPSSIPSNESNGPPKLSSECTKALSEVLLIYASGFGPVTGKSRKLKVTLDEELGGNVLGWIERPTECPGDGDEVPFAAFMIHEAL